MKTVAALVILVVACHVMSCSDGRQKGTEGMSNQGVRDDLLLLQTQRIYFGHQSVGGNIVAGIKGILTIHKDIMFNLVALNDSITLPGTFFAESLIGRNTHPETKCSAFVQSVDSLFRSGLDLALMKFCYVDFTAETDVHQVFDYYTSSMESLKSRHPLVRFVHVTVPLKSRDGAFKALIKSLLGRQNNSDSENLKRNNFNTMLRQQCSNEPIFDLATVESTYPDGSRERFDVDGQPCYALIGEYTSDGGHLNEAGSQRAAEALLHTLANVVRGEHQ